MHDSTFGYHKPTVDQFNKGARLRAAASIYCNALEAFMPDGPDKTYAIRKHREVAMWALVGLTRLPDGTPRE